MVVVSYTVRRAAALSQVHSAVLVLILRHFYSFVAQNHSVLYHLHPVALHSFWKIHFLTLSAQTTVQGSAKLERGDKAMEEFGV